MAFSEMQGFRNDHDPEHHECDFRCTLFKLEINSLTNTDVALTNDVASYKRDSTLRDELNVYVVGGVTDFPADREGATIEIAKWYNGRLRVLIPGGTLADVPCMNVNV